MRKSLSWLLLSLFVIFLSKNLNAQTAPNGPTSLSDNNDVNNAQAVKVYVDTYSPYINKPNESLGTSATLLKTLSEYANIDIEFVYVPYGDAIKLMNLKKEAISFPLFYTDERAELFYFSKPVSIISIEVYFNRQFGDLSNIDKMDELNIGIVSDYSYGEKIDRLLTKVTEFDSDSAALTALINKKIDLLPMAKGVMEDLLSNRFSAQRELIRPIENIKGSEKFYVMAPKTHYGKNLVDKINKAILQKFGSEELLLQESEKAQNVDVAELIPAEGFPAIIGESISDQLNYTLPIGTKVMVLDWSEAIRQANPATSINRNMLLTSKVVVLNGPHVGKEMMVRNMHIKLN